MDRIVTRTSCYWNRKKNIEDIHLEHLSNPWNVFTVLTSPQPDLNKWMRSRGLLTKNMQCDRTGCHYAPCNLNKRDRNIDGETWRCRKGHELGIRYGSMFHKGKLFLQDILVFIFGYLDQCTLLKLSRRTGFNYKTTCVKWASKMRDIMMAWVVEKMATMRFSGIVEIDESLFGRRVKYHRGKCHVNVMIKKYIKC